jgi:hypothetical protein
MTTFHPRHSDCGRRVHKKANASAFNFTSQIPPSIYAVMHTKHDKRGATIFKSRCSRTVLCYRFDKVEALPLVRQGFYGSPMARRKMRGVPRDGRAMGAKHPARNPAKCLASCPRNVPAMAGQWQQQCRRTSVKTTRKTTCLAPDLDAQCPRRKLARQLATWPRNSRETSRKMTRQNPAVMF